MNPRMPGGFHLSKEASYALTRGLPIVALESAVITHGLPRPTNLELARELEQIVRQGGAVPATIALMNGLIKVGLTENELMDLAQRDDVIKISLRNMGIGIARGYNGGTTVAATLFAAQKSGIKTFATGGIGGVHRGQVFDISADLNALAEIRQSWFALVQNPSLTSPPHWKRSKPVVCQFWDFEPASFPPFIPAAAAWRWIAACMNLQKWLKSPVRIGKPVIAAQSWL